jgi:hypothetical protein
MSEFVVSVAAASRGLLTTAQLRAAAGLASGDTSQDTSLAAMNLTVSDIITDWCRIAEDGIEPPTLLQETLVETFYPECRGCRLYLARRFVGTISVVEAGTTLTEATHYTVDRARGIATRRSTDGTAIAWNAGKIVVTYQAGFAAVPTPLADVAAEMVARKAGAARDPLMKRERVKVDGVSEVEQEFWADAKNDADITPDMAEKLSRYLPSQVF